MFSRRVYTACNVVCINQRFGGAYWLHFQEIRPEKIKEHSRGVRRNRSNIYISKMAVFSALFAL
jgi:hypothetical protein